MPAQIPISTAKALPGPAAARADILAAIGRHWGYDALRPLQAEAIGTSLKGRDSLVVMPTGGGKSLCYQVPPLLTGRLCLVVSPLISLMEDQVAGLRLAGYPAAALHSNLSAQELSEIRERVTSGALRLVLVAPERLLAESFLGWLKGLARESAVGSIAIDEAHCISQWGHDFRPEYRRLAELRGHFPGGPLHAYTATATPRVREDIVEQLRLRNPAVLVGRFDRPNLTYRVVPRVRLVDQIAGALERHRSEGRQHAAIVYCISRKDTETVAAALLQRGMDARPYHAGLDAAKRAKVSRDFKTERLSIVVATVAFGMGIDRGDVRCVIHAAMPKTVEHYQQETGRAGRDGLPAECVLFYSAADAARWRQVMQFGADENGSSPEFLEAQFRLLTQMQRVCTSARCRHRALSEHFGQEYEGPEGGGGAGCGACDVCLAELDTVPDADEVAKKILSCVYRVNGTFGAAHIADILRGKATARIVERRHNELSTFGLLSAYARDDILSFINQLIDAGVLERTTDQYPVLGLNAESGRVLRGQRPVTLLKAPRVAENRASRSARTDEPLSVAEQRVFEALRAVRRSVADELGVPPFVVFGDTTLNEMSRVRPSDLRALATVRGVGQAKLAQFGERFLGAIREAAGSAGLPLDSGVGSRAGVERAAGREVDPDGKRSVSANRSRAYARFAEGGSVREVAAELGLAAGTVGGYLAEYVREAMPETVARWVDDATYRAVVEATRGHETARLKPVYDALGGRVPYDQIRVVMAHRYGRNWTADPEA
jgi:ATP-dependent DNA helicase RecQ